MKQASPWTRETVYHHGGILHSCLHRSALTRVKQAHSFSCFFSPNHNFIMIWTSQIIVKCSRATILTWTRKKQRKHQRPQANEEPDMNLFDGGNHVPRQSTRCAGLLNLSLQRQQQLHQFVILIRLKSLATFMFRSKEWHSALSNQPHFHDFARQK